MLGQFARLSRFFVVAGAFAIFLAACENLGLRAEPEEITVEVESDGTGQVTVITSTNWVFISDPVCDPQSQQCDEILRVQSADTASFAAPYRRTYRFDNRHRYLVETFPTDSVAATLSLRIFIDGESWYSDSRPLQPATANEDRESLLFTYVWQEPTLR